MRFKALLSLLIAMFFAAAAAAQIASPPPAPARDPENTWLLDLSTGGRVAIQLRPDVAPKMVERIKVLTRRGFYNGLAFHRVIPGFMAQGGDPKGDGSGGSDLPDVKAEFTGVPFLRGMFGAARSDSPDSANSQFFIMLGRTSTLDNNYTVLGRVVAGMDAVDAIAPGEPPENPTKIVQAWLGDAPRPPLPVPAPVAAPAVAPAPVPPPAPAG